MVDMSNKTIKRLFQQQIRELTKKTIERQQDDVFDYQMSGAWIR